MGDNTQFNNGEKPEQDSVQSMSKKTNLQTAYSDTKQRRDRSISGSKHSNSQRPLKNSLSGIQAYGHLSSLNNGSPVSNRIKLAQGLSSSYSKTTPVSERDEGLKVKLAQIDKHLDINKLLAEVQLQANDSYTLRSLLKKLKEMANELLKAENVLHLKAIALV